MQLKEKITLRISAIFVEIFGKNIPEINRRTTSSDIDGWDYFNNLNLVAAIEQSFRIRFSAKEIESFKNVGDLVDKVLEKIHN